MWRASTASCFMLYALLNNTVTLQLDENSLAEKLGATAATIAVGNDDRHGDAEMKG